MTMNVRRKVGGVALLAVAAVAGCGQAGAEGTAGEAFVRIVNVEVLEVATEPFVDQIRLTGTVWANRDVQVAAEESGVIREILKEKGARVRAGDALARIDGAVLSAQVEQARAMADLAAQSWERRRRLWEEDRVGSEIAYLEAKYGAEQSAANLRALEERLARTVIRAPFEGVLEERLVEVGTLVSPGQVVARIVDLDPVKVVAGVPERFAAEVQAGAVAQILVDVLPGRVLEAPIGFVGATVNPQNRTFPIEIVVPNPGVLIKPEMVASVAVARRDLEAALVVPQDALVRVENGYVVFVVVERDGAPVAEVRQVVLGPTQRNMAVVEAGVEPGDRLIVVGQRSVADGDRVKVVATR